MVESGNKNPQRANVAPAADTAGRLGDADARPACDREAPGRLDAAEREKTEPIAIVGMSCRFPGAPDVEAYWSLLRNGVDAIGEVPPDRWDVDAYYDPEPGARRPKMVTRWGGFLAGRRPVRPAVLRHLAARGQPRWTRSSGCCSRSPGKPWSARGWRRRSCAGSRTGVFVGISQATTA